MSAAPSSPEPARPAGPFRILHVSDLHYCVPFAGRFGKRLIGSLNWTLFRGRLHDHGRAERLLGGPGAGASASDDAPTPDVVLVTGDLTQLGHTSEMSRPLELLDALAERGVRVLSVPGNHDCYVKDADAAAAVAELFDRNGGDEHTPGLRVVRTGPVEWILLSQATPQPWWMSAGRMDAETWAALDRLAETSTDDAPPVRIAAGHFPVRTASGLPLPRTHALADAPRLEALLGRLGATLYCCGHIHSPSVRELESGCRQVVAGSLTAEGSRAEIAVRDGEADVRIAGD